jgi:MFS family permease
MLERFKRTDGHGAVAHDDEGAVATAERPDADTAVADRPIRRTSAVAGLDTVRARQRDEFGGVNWGASFFGWLVAVGIVALLTSLLVAAGAAIGLTESDVTNSEDEITLGGGIALVVVLLLAYYAGGYVAGRMSRFDGGRQGMATWAIGLIVAVCLAIAAAIFGDEYNVLEELNLPAVPVGDQALTTGGLIALAVIVIGSLLTAMTGGKLGERYHKRVDRAGFMD